MASGGGEAGVVPWKTFDIRPNGNRRSNRVLNVILLYRIRGRGGGEAISFFVQRRWHPRVRPVYLVTNKCSPWRAFLYSVST